VASIVARVVNVRPLGVVTESVSTLVTTGAVVVAPPSHRAKEEAAPEQEVDYMQDGPQSPAVLPPRPCLDISPWLDNEIRVVKADDLPAIPLECWQTIIVTMMKVHGKWMEYLINSGRPVEEWMGFDIIQKYYHDELQCGILQLREATKARLFREVLLKCVAASPPLQFLLLSDPMEQIVSSYVPSTSGYTTEQYLKFLGAHNPPLRQHKFEVIRMEPYEQGFVFRFRTCQEVVAYLQANNFCLPHVCGTTRFSRTISRGILNVGSTPTMELDDEAQEGQGAQT